MIYFLDFDKTIANIVIEDFEKFRSDLRINLWRKYKIDNSLAPILNSIDEIEQINSKAATYCKIRLMDLEINANTKIYPYTKLLFTYLNTINDVVTIVVSDNCYFVINEFLKLHSLNVNLIVSRDNYNKRKPTCWPYVYALNCLNINHLDHEIISIGDSNKDLEGAKSLGNYLCREVNYVHINEFLKDKLKYYG